MFDMEASTINIHKGFVTRCVRKRICEYLQHSYIKIFSDKIDISHYSYQQCRCVHPNEWSARWIVLPGTETIIEAPLCNISDPCYSLAAVRIAETTSLWDQYCFECDQECSSVSFTITKSSVAAPSRYYASITKAFVESLEVPLPTNWSTNWLSEVENNYVSFDVVCESTSLENYTQEASISPVNVLRFSRSITIHNLPVHTFVQSLQFFQVLRTPRDVDEGKEVFVIHENIFYQIAGTSQS